MVQSWTTTEMEMRDEEVRVGVGVISGGNIKGMRQSLCEPRNNEWLYFLVLLGFALDSGVQG